MTTLPDIGYAERSRIFGTPGSQDGLVVVTTPWGLRARVHRLVAERFLAAFALAQSRSRWVPRRIDSYAARKIRGKTAASLHAYGLAVDVFDLPLPQVPEIWGPTNAPDDRFRSAFVFLGFRAGASYSSRKDFPHLEWVGGIPEPIGPVRVASTRIQIAPPEPVGSMPRPPQTRVLEEVEGVKVTTVTVDWERLDDKGRGWVMVGWPMERVLSVTAQGSDPRPDRDNVYWPPIVCTMQPQGAETLVTLAGAPRQGGLIYCKILDG